MGCNTPVLGRCNTVSSKRTVIVSVRMPNGLKARVDQLARKGDITRNEWIVKALARGARYTEPVSLNTNDMGS